jgi:hypothetical protein
MTVIEKIDKSYTEVLDEGIIPCLLVINSNDVITLFTEEVKSELSMEDWFLENYNTEILTTELKTDPEFTGKFINKDE